MKYLTPVFLKTDFLRALNPECVPKDITEWPGFHLLIPALNANL